VSAIDKAYKIDHSLGILDEMGVRYLTVPRGPSLLVVGPDRVGKTVLVNHISTILGVPQFKCPTEKQIFKQGGRSSLVFDYTMTRFLQQTGYRFISDRAYPCEWVYSKVFNRETDDQLLKMIDDGHANLGTVILNVFSSVPPSEEDDLVPADKYWDVTRKYQDFKAWTSCDVVTVDTAQMIQAFQDGEDISKRVAEEVLENMGWL
jgi:hypothetical protein